MRPVSDKLFTEYRDQAGLKFRGYLSEASKTTAAVPYRLFMVRTPSPVQVGSVVFRFGQPAVILLQHPQEFDWCVSFKAAYVNEVYPWSRPGKVLDPVAKVLRDSGSSQFLGNLYVNFERGVIVDVLGFSEARYSFMTGQDVRVGDVVGGKTVKTVVEVLGVRIAQAQ